MSLRSLVVRLAGVALVATSLLVAGPAPPAEADGNEAPGAPAAARGLTAGNLYSCAVLANGSLRCWGDGGQGRLGLGDTNARGNDPSEMGTALPEVSLGSGRTVTAVSAGGFHTCAVLDNGTVKCWGASLTATLGLGDTTTRGDGPGEMGDSLPTVALGTGRTAVAVSANSTSTCVVLDNATVKCWGANSSGQLGLGDVAVRGNAPGQMGDSLPAVNLGTGRTATAVTVGNNHACALLDNASVKCWGGNGSGRLGLGDTANRGDAGGEMGDSLAAVPLGTGRTATAVTAGAQHTCAILDNGSVKCWGLNSSGQLGLGDAAARGDAGGEMGDSLPAVNLGTGRTATALAADGNTTCAILDNGSVKCWGANTSGQLGLGDLAARGDAAGEMGDSLPAVPLGTGRTATAVTVGTSHACAVLDSGARKCWGENGSGQLGQGDTADRGDSANETGNHLPAIPLAPPGLSGTITDSVSGAPLAGAFIAVLRTADFAPATSLVADGSGNYSAAVPAGTYFFYVIDPTGAHTAGFSGPPTMYTVTNAAILDADATMVPTRGSISGTVTDADTAAPVAGVWALAISATGGISKGAFTAADGTYTIGGLPVGNYRLTFFDGAGGRVQEYWDDATSYAGATDIAVSAGSAITGRDATLAFP